MTVAVPRTRVTFNDVANFAARNKLLALNNPVVGGTGLKIVYRNVTHWANVCEYFAVPDRDCIRFSTTREAIAFIHGWQARG